MHRYSSDENRVTTYALLAVPAVAISWLLVKLVSIVEWPEWLVSVPAVSGSYVLCYGLFDRILWRTRFARALRLSTTPDVSGKYEGTLTSTYLDDQGEQAIHPIKVVVEQTWTHLHVRMDVGEDERTSSSVSFMGAISSEGSSCRLGYCYRNKINPAVADEDMGDHEGTADLVITGGVASGRYYNSRPRSGAIEARRV
jgi:hypothetical protein